MSQTAPKTRRGDVIDHIDPAVSDLVCGLDIEINKLVMDCTTNMRKSNRFVPYMVDSDMGIHQEFGDWGIFLIQDKWCWCEFGGAEWWAESKRLGFGPVKAGKINGSNHAKNKTGVCGRSAEQMTADGKKGGEKGGKISGKISSKITNAQQWQCLITGHISNPGGLSTYQKARGIDTSLRERVYFVAIGL